MGRAVAVSAAAHVAAGPHGAPGFDGSLDIGFFARPAARVARDLLGKVIESSVDGVRCRCRIVETEAYIGPEDEASHAAARIGRTRRNEVMFGRPGLAYVYRIYGVHWCLNAVTDRTGHPAAVLIRAAEPLGGIEVARERRGGPRDDGLMRGPGNLCRALGITGTHDGHPLDRDPLQILEDEDVPDAAVLRGPRVGVTRAADLPLRFWIGGHPCVSRRPGGNVGAAYRDRPLPMNASGRRSPL